MRRTNRQFSNLFAATQLVAYLSILDALQEKRCRTVHFQRPLSPPSGSLPEDPTLRPIAPLRDHMAERSSLHWPALPHLLASTWRGKVIFDTLDRDLDLSDRLMLYWPKASRTVYLAVSTKSKDWRRWDEQSLSIVENHVRYDLRFESYSVTVRRVTVQPRQPPLCTTAFHWQLRIGNRFFE